MIKGFDQTAYLEANDDILKGEVEQKRALHEIATGKHRFHKDFDPFDEKLYLEKYHDVKEQIGEGRAFKSAFDHFCQFGYREILSGKRRWPKAEEKTQVAEENRQNIQEESSNNYDLTQQEKHEYFIIAQCKKLDWEKYREDYNVGTDDPIIHFIKSWKEYRPVFADFFDTAYYLEQYKDIAEPKGNPLVQFLEFGEKKGRLAVRKREKAVKPMETQVESTGKSYGPNLTNVQKYEYDVIVSYGLDWGNYFEINSFQGSEYTDPIEHYIVYFQELRPIVDGVFNTNLYYSQYPDIEEAGVNPLIHYIKHGKAEGRTGWVDMESHITRGAKPSNQYLQTLIIATHESSATGAPLVSLNIAREFCDRYNVINIVQKKSKLHDDFLEVCEYLIEDVTADTIIGEFLKSFLEDRQIYAVICNSVETLPVLKAASELGLPTVSLVHEFADYTRFLGKMSHTIFYANRVIVPAKVIIDSIHRELKELHGVRNFPDNIFVQPQGKLPMIPEGSGENESKREILNRLNIQEDDTTTRIVIGAGYVQIRKGVDIFLSMAKQVQERYRGKCKFVWVGAGYEPVGQEYSVWLKKQADMIEGDNDFIFLEHQKDLDNVLELTDTFALTSRLDPFPNVVIDAMMHNVHIACFEYSTGCAEFLDEHEGDASIVDYLDTSKMADAIIENFEKYETSRRVRNEQIVKNSEIVKEYLDFDKYLDYLLKVCKDAYEISNENEKITRRLLKENQFNASYYSADYRDRLDKEVVCRSYVNMGQKGIHLFNPKPGFSERYWINVSGGRKRNQVALYQALLEGQAATHEVVFLEDKNDVVFSKKYAIHIHLYYVDLAEELSEYFSKLNGDFDLFITMVDMEEEEEVRSVFSSCGASDVFVIKVENRGRDIIPFFAVLKDHIFNGEYEVVGHFHSKKSLEVNKDMGNDWRRFIMDHLVSMEVISLFEQNEVGLVFPDDRHCVDFAANKPFADELCEDMGIDPMEYANIYPLGTMFWAKTDAIKPLFMLDYEKYVEEEPLPYDGSYLHAIERLIPHVVKHQGYTFKTVYRKGSAW